MKYTDYKENDMSILNDYRRYSDNEEEREQWEEELKREYAREQYEQDHRGEE